MNSKTHEVGMVGQDPPAEYRRATRFPDVAAMRYAGHTVDLTPEELAIVGPMNRTQRRAWLRVHRR